MARPRKNAPKVGGTQEIKQGLERQGIDVQFLQDLEHYDRTEVYGKEKGKYYRWCRESDIGLRERQGYAKTDGKGLKVAAPGGTTYWSPEGAQAKMQGRGLVLMEMPKELNDARQAFKQQKRDEQEARMEADLRRDMANRVDPMQGGVLSADDSFVRDLRGGK